jgi:hypothetical protein
MKNKKTSQTGEKHEKQKKTHIMFVAKSCWGLLVELHTP